MTIARSAIAVIAFWSRAEGTRESYDTRALECGRSRPLSLILAGWDVATTRRSRATALQGGDAGRWTPGGWRPFHRLVAGGIDRRHAVALAVVVSLRLIVHALYVPAYEGPDEPFHLAKIVAFEDAPTDSGRREAFVDPEIVASVARHPCGPDLHRAIGCRPFIRHPAEVDAPTLTPGALDLSRVRNYEAHQPPLYYVATGAIERIVDPLRPPHEQAAIWQLSVARLSSVLLVIIAVAWPMQAIAASLGWRWYCASMLVLLVPGASESLARCANDACVFAWSAFAMLAVRRRSGPCALVFIAFVGPLAKLTAVPVVVFLVVWAWMTRSAWQGLAVGFVSALIIPIQWLRGYAWGGTVELNGDLSATSESLATACVGFVRSAYTFAKTTFWLGEWSVFRAPVWLLVLVGAFVALCVASLKIRDDWRNRIPESISLIVAAASCAVWFVAHRRFWGGWGGVGGWYAWGWFPWLAVVIASLVAVREKWRRPLFAVGAIIVVVSNVAWFVVAQGVYAFR